MSKWEPIETAPRDGTVIVATDGVFTEKTMFVCGGWICGCCDLEWIPTRWMPLPESPSE